MDDGHINAMDHTGGLDGTMPPNGMGPTGSLSDENDDLGSGYYGANKGALVSNGIIDPDDLGDDDVGDVGLDMENDL